MELPITVWELRLWLAINAILLLITSELLYSYSGRAFMINKRRLKTAAQILGIAFMITVLIQAYQTLQALPP